MMQPPKPFRHRIGRRRYSLTVEPVADRWYAEAGHRGVPVAAGSGDTPGEALAFVRALPGEPAGSVAA